MTKRKAREWWVVVSHDGPFDGSVFTKKVEAVRLKRSLVKGSEYRLPQFAEIVLVREVLPRKKRRVKK